MRKTQGVETFAAARYNADDVMGERRGEREGERHRECVREREREREKRERLAATRRIFNRALPGSIVEQRLRC